MRKETDALSEDLGKSKPLPLSEIGNPGPVEKVTESDFIKKEIELEAFMNEILTVVVHPDANDNSVEHPCPCVNGLNQPFIRGHEQKVKRKYVEALARTRVTKYEQKTVDPSRPENIQMYERTALSYPFTVVHDPNPIGREWLKAILAQPC
jgi:hypothetical protein